MYIKFRDCIWRWNYRKVIYLDVEREYNGEGI